MGRIVIASVSIGPHTVLSGWGDWSECVTTLLDEHIIYIGIATL